MKNLNIILAISVPILTVAVGYGIFQQKQVDLKEDVQKIERSVAKNVHEIDEVENINIKQSMIMKGNLKMVEGNTRLIRALEKKF